MLCMGHVVQKAMTVPGSISIMINYGPFLLYLALAGRSRVSAIRRETTAQTRSCVMW